MKRRLLLGVLAGMMMTLPASLVAQRPRQLPAAQRPAAPIRERQVDTGGRARLEAEVRRNFARVVRQQVGLSDEQMRRLVPVTQRHEQQRRQLQMQERDTRMSLRDIVVGRAADSSQAGALMQRLIDIQKRRVEILEAEQRELGAFMSPVQRAKFMALQEQIRRRTEQMRQRRVP